MNDRNANQRLESFERAVTRLEEALAVPADAPLAIDGTIQRFEFAFELCWKTMRGFLELEGRSVASAPRAVFKGAYAMGWIDDENAWIELMEMRNASSHIYNEKMANDIYRRIRTRAALLRAAAETLRSHAAH